MRVRTRSALIAIALFAPFIFLGDIFFAIIIAILGLFGLREIARMKQIPYKNLIGVTSSIALLSILIPSHYIHWVSVHVNNEFLFYICCLMLLILTVFHSESFNFDDAATLVLGAIYIGYGFHFLILIRDMGIDTLMYQFAVIWSTDTGAYITGRFFGKHKLSPMISPNKTIEGFVGGIIFATIVGGINNAFIDPNLGNINNIWILSIAMSAFGQLGDLVESAFKRHFGVKDSGNFLPGHGGVLDRFDSTIFTSFLFMIWMNLFR